jgi:hypothetical protein
MAPSLSGLLLLLEARDEASALPDFERRMESQERACFRNGSGIIAPLQLVRRKRHAMQIDVIGKVFCQHRSPAKQNPGSLGEMVAGALLSLLAGFR